MKQLLFLFCFFCSKFSDAYAQQLVPTVLSSSGSSKNAGGLLLEDYVGGLAVSAIHTGTFMYTQGFLQPYAGITNGPLYINDVLLISGTGVDNAGTTFVNGGLMLEFTIGETASITLSGGSGLLTQGILQPYPAGNTLPVNGLEFTVRRINATTVQLDWSTILEYSNKGFYIERRKENENNFSIISYVSSKAPDGNSSFPLDYQLSDHNNFSGKTLYRLRQEDMDGRSTYSVVRIVNGSNGKQAMMQVWPVPATGPVQVLVSGLSSDDKLLVFDLSGKLVRQVQVSDGRQVQLNSLTTGTYILRLEQHRELVQKIMILK